MTQRPSGPWTGLTEIASDGESVTLRRFSGKIPLPAHATADWLAQNAQRIRTGAVIDVETTGLDRKNDEVIELGLRKFRYDCETGEVLTVDHSFTALQDPGHPLSDEIRELTGLTDEDLHGKSIDWEKANALLSDVDLIIAHNAAFDRPFIDRHMPTSRERLWACSFKHIDWDTKAFPSAKLEILCLYHGFFTAAHRAQNDVDAALCLLSLQDPNTGQPYLKEMMERAQQPTLKIIAAGSPFETKDLLKARGYRWDNAARVWQKTLPESAWVPEREWLEAHIYRGTFRGLTESISALNQFKS